MLFMFRILTTVLVFPEITAFLNGEFLFPYNFDGILLYIGILKMKL